jgi:ankyrin repeat protein
MTPLHKALLYGQTNTVRYLLAKYPQCVNATDHAGRTALHYSAADPNGEHMVRKTIDFHLCSMFLDQSFAKVGRWCFHRRQIWTYTLFLPYTWQATKHPYAEGQCSNKSGNFNGNYFSRLSVFSKFIKTIIILSSMTRLVITVHYYLHSRTKRSENVFD